MKIITIFQNPNFLVSLQSARCFSTTSIDYGNRNFKKFTLVRRGTEFEKKRQKENPDPELTYTNFGIRNPTFKIGKKQFTPKENIPELIVPDLTNCELKPYASYRAAEVEQPEFTAKELFDSIYAEKIFKDFKAKKLDEAGNSLEPSPYETLTKEEAMNKAKKCHSDMFDQISPYVPRRIREGYD